MHAEASLLVPLRMQSIARLDEEPMRVNNTKYDAGASPREGSGGAILVGQPISPGSQQEGYEGEQPGSASTRHLDDAFSNKSATGMDANLQQVWDHSTNPRAFV